MPGGPGPLFPGWKEDEDRDIEGICGYDWNAPEGDDKDA